ncbi:MAG: FxsA family protein [Magnetospirillum sp.]|nr:FxsA family protein [Magnetospirillum sp.]
MAWLVLAAVVALPIVEIALFVKSAQWLGFLPTLMAAVAAGAIGLALVRRQGFELLMRARTQFDRGEVPVREAFDAICLAMAGALLLLPGFFTDILAILLLLPPVRAVLRLWLAARLVAAGAAPGQGPGARPPAGPRVIETEYRVIDEKD